MPDTDFDAMERRSWAGYAATYWKSYARVCAGTVAQLTEAAGVGAGMRVLDVGTGTGTAAAAAAALGATVTAVDADPGMIALAAAQVPGVEFGVAALPALPFEDGQFAAILANFVINHVGRPRAALAELRRVTAPGGRIALTIWPQPPSPGISLLTRAIEECGAQRRSLRLPPAEEFARTQAGLHGLLAAAGVSSAQCAMISWRLAVDPDEWWGIASGACWMGEFAAVHPPELLDRVRRRFDELSTEYADHDGQLALPFAALLARGQA
jgi:SAM-dependent methyltransferase